jgi:hypothetical protein
MAIYGFHFRKVVQALPVYSNATGGYSLDETVRASVSGRFAASENEPSPI